MQEVDVQEIQDLLDSYDRDPSQLISILHDVQAKYNWTPKKALVHISNGLGIPISRAYSVASFYKAFRTTPRGRHLVRICLGTACHVRGASKVMEKARDNLNIKQGDTTKDLQFTVERVNCLGCCAMGPVVMVDDDYHRNLTPADVENVLAQYD